MRATTCRPRLEQLEVRNLLHGAIPTIYTQNDHTINAHYDSDHQSLSLEVLDTGHGAATDPDDTLLVATPAAKTTQLQDPALAFLGAQPGEKVWVLTGAPGTILPGLGALNIPNGTFVSYDTGDARTAGVVAPWVKFQLIDVHGPSPNARFAAFDFGGPGGSLRVWMASNDGLDPADVAYAVAQGTDHLHPFFAFTSPGTYQIDLQASVFIDNGMGGMTPVQSAVTSFEFQVVDSVVVTGPERGQAPLVRDRDAVTGQPRFDLLAYEETFRGGVRVATGDVNGDGVFDIITAPGPGRDAEIHVYDGLTGTLLHNFPAFAGGFRNGVNLAAGNFDKALVGDEIVVAPERGKQPVQVFSVTDLSAPRTPFFPYGPGYRYGIRVAAANVDGHSPFEIVTAPIRGKVVRIFEANVDLANHTTGWTELNHFTPFKNPGLGGLYVAVADLNLDQDRNEIIVGTGQGAHLKVFSFDHDELDPTKAITLATQLDAFPAPTPGGVRLGVLDVNGDGFDDLLVGARQGRRAVVRVLSSPIAVSPEPPGNVAQFPAGTELETFWAYEGSLTPGAFVAGARYG